MATATAEEGSVGRVGDYIVDFRQQTLSCGPTTTTVYNGRHVETNEDVAVKEVDPKGGTDEEKEAARAKESVHRYLLDENVAHPNLVTILAVEVLRSVLYVVTGLCAFGNLNDHFKRNRALCATGLASLMEMVPLMKDMASGLAPLHSKGIAHRNLDPTNILVSATGAKVGGFGSMRRPGSVVGASPFPSFFQAPEQHEDVLAGGLPSDIFSLGLIFTAMVQAEPGKTLLPVAEGSRLACICTIGRDLLQKPDLEILPDRPEDQPMLAELKQLIRQMLQVRPEDRPTAAEVELTLGLLVKRYDGSEQRE